MVRQPGHLGVAMRFIVSLTFAAGLCVIAMLGSGCATQKTWVYRANSYPMYTSQSTNGIAVVRAFEDSRSPDNDNLVGLYLIPLMPYGWSEYAAPEGAPMHITSALWLNYKPTEDYPKALAVELEKANLFKDVHFGYGKENADYLISGRIINTDYLGRIFSYGFSVYGPLLWFVGFPAGTVRNDLEIELTCLDVRANRVILNKTYRADTRSHVTFLYYLGSDFEYAAMLAEVYASFTRDLQQSMARAAIR